MHRITIAVPLALVFALIGCGSGSTGASGTSTGAAQKAQGKTLKLVYIPKNTGNPYFDEVERGFEQAAKEAGDEFATTGPASPDATSQIPIIKEQIQRGVDVIAISPNSPDALNPVLDEARSRGITVITVDADLVGNESHRDVAVLPTDFDKVGSGQIALMSQLMGGEGEFAILSATTDAPNQNAWIATMKEELKKPAYSKMRLVDVVYGEDKPQESTTVAEGLISKYPNLRGIVAPTSVGLAAGAQVVQQQGVYPGGPKANGKGLEITGLSTPNQLRRFVQQGVVKQFQLWAPYNEGYIAAVIGRMIHDGRVKPASGVEVEIPTMGKRTFSPKLELTGGPLLTFNKTNIVKYDF